MELTGYQVVRHEYGSDQDVVQVSFNRGYMYVNSYGLARFPEEDYIQVLVDEDTRSMVIKPLVKKKRDSFKWSGGIKKRKPRHIGCMPLFYMVYRMMEWDIQARYRITGEIEDYGEQKVIFLDLTSAVCFVREGGRSRMLMAEEWLKNFGLPYMDYENRQDIKIFEDMAVFDVRMDTVGNAREMMAGIRNQDEEEANEKD